MRQHRRAAVALLAAALGTAVIGAGAAAADPNPPLAPGLPRATGAVAAAGSSERVTPAMASATGTVTAFVELAETPAIDTYTAEKSKGRSNGEASAAAKQTKQHNANTADHVLDVLRGKDSGTEVVARTGNAVPGVTVVADAAKVRELASLPEVKSVRLSVAKTSDNASSDQLTRALNVWQQTGHYGDGVRIGIIDTGIDYTHADFGGPGTKAAYDAIDRTKADPSQFPTAKVVGGYDFAGDAYDARFPNDPAKATPHPDPNPLDCGSHGTHVAGTAAGYGENADGSTFTGDYGKLTAADLNAMKIGPGTAPHAQLYALKVFGCEGSTNLTTQAMDWALDPDGDGDFSDHLDIVNMSLGTDFGAADDPDALFVRKLVAAGVMVVTSAGNGGDIYDVGGSPGDTPETLDVADSLDAFALLDGVEVAGAQRPGQYSSSFTGYDTLDLTKPAAALTDPANADGCQLFSPADKAAVAGKFAWLEWNDDDSTRKCGSAVRTNNAQAAGAVGVLLSSTRDNFLAGIAGNAGVPVFQFTGTATAAVRPALTAGTLQVRMRGALRSSVPTTTPKLADTISPSSARGARGAAGKPDLAAPGESIVSAAVGTGNGMSIKTGTSMASPHAAGIAALLRQLHPDWTVEEVKAGLINTADGDVHAGDDATANATEAPMRVGAGRIDALAATGNQVLAYVRDTPGAVGVSFGAVEAGGPVSVSKTVKVVNKSTRAVTLKTSFAASTTVPGAGFALSTDTVTLAPRGISSFQVTFTVADPTALRKTADPTLVRTQAGQARQYLAEASGRIVLTPTSGGTPLRLPVYAAPKPVAAITEPGSVRFSGGQTQAILNVSGRGVDQGSGDQRYRSLLSAFELQATSPKLPDCTDHVKTDCAINGTAKGGDLRYVGAASTAPLAKAQGHPEQAQLAFGIATWQNWANLGSNTWPEVWLNLHGGDKPEFKVRVAKPKDANGTTTADLWLARTVKVNADGSDGAVVDQQPVNGQFGDVDTNVFDSDVVVLPVTLTALGIDPKADSARLRYTVGTAGFYAAPGNQDGFVDKLTSILSYDPLRPGLWVQGGGDPALSYLARPGTALVVNRDPASLAADNADSLLILNHHNASGHRAQVVRALGATRPAA
jgi:subtilisin family serine protease